MTHRAELSPESSSQDSIEVLFNTTDHIEVHIQTGTNESINDILKRYSYIFSSEKAARIYEPTKLNRYWATETSADQHKRLKQDFIEDELPFGLKNDSEKVVRIKKEIAFEMTKTLFFPPKDQATTDSRHVLLSELIASPELDQMTELTVGTYALIEGLHEISSQDVDFNEDDYYYLDQFYAGKTKRISSDMWFGRDDDAESELETYPELVSRCVDTVSMGLSNLNALYEHIMSTQSVGVRAAFEYLDRNITIWNEQLTQLVPFDKQPSAENASRNDVIMLSKLSDSIEEYVIHIASVLEWAKKLRDEEWGSFTMDPSQPDGYVGSWNMEEAKAEQTHNYCPQDEQLLVVSGPTTSGKSYLQRTDLLVRLAAQSFRFAPAQDGGNIVPYNGYYFIERMTGDSDEELSAYMKEIDVYADILSEMPDQVRLYLDEGGSTTSPDGQARLVFGIAQDVINRGGSVFLGTHNDELLQYLANRGQTIYRMASSMGKNGEFIRYFQLEEGVGDSHATEAARAQHVPENFIRHAENYLDGHIEHPFVPERIFASIRRYTESIRRKMKRESVDLGHLFESSAANQFFVKFSVDKVFRPDRLLRYKQTDVDVLVRGFDEHALKERIGQMILEGRELTIEEILERQQMFVELRRDGFYKDILANIGDLLFFDDAVEKILRFSRNGVNNGLNPFAQELKRKHKEHDHFIYISDCLDASIAYLHMQQKLLGTSFDEGELLWQVTKLRVLYQMVQDRTGSYNLDYKEQYGEAYENLNNEEIALFGNLNKKFFYGHIEVSFQSVTAFANKLLLKVEKSVQLFPPMNVSQVQIADIEEELRALEYFHALGNNWSVPESEFSDLQRNMARAIFSEGELPRALLHLPQMLHKLSAFTNELRQRDSVYLNQLANAIDAHVDRSLMEIEMGVGAPGERNDVSICLEQLATVAYFAAIIDHEDFTPVEFNETGEVVFEKITPLLLDFSKGIGTTVTISTREHVRVLTGPHGSGKTSIEEEMVLNALMGSQTGLVSCGYCTMPKFDRAVYFDRIVQREDASLSSGAQEMEQWKKLLKIIYSNFNVFTASSIDELGSTFSPRYQAAFNYAMIMAHMETGQKLMLATHNHAFVETLLRSGIPGMAPYHLSFDITDRGVMFGRQMVPGVAGSYPLEIARMNPKFPERIVQIAAQMDL